MIISTSASAARCGPRGMAMRQSDDVGGSEGACASDESYGVEGVMRQMTSKVPYGLELGRLLLRHERWPDDRLACRHMMT